MATIQGKTFRQVQSELVQAHQRTEKLRKAVLIARSLRALNLKELSQQFQSASQEESELSKQFVQLQQV